MALRFGTASRPAAGGDVCGDAGVIIPVDQGSLICLADGLGHGPEARAAADAACRYARAHSAEPLDALMRGMDGALSVTRGAAVSLLAILPSLRQARFAGVGNVELRILRRSGPPTSPGVVGRRMRPARVWDVSIAHGDLLVLVTDGISSRFELDDYALLEPAALAENLVRQHHKVHDDACCIAVKVAITGIA